MVMLIALTKRCWFPLVRMLNSKSYSRWMTRVAQIFFAIDVQLSPNLETMVNFNPIFTGMHLFVLSLSCTCSGTAMHLLPNLVTILKK